MPTSNLHPSSEDIVKIFEQMEELAKQINPLLITDIKSYTDNHVGLESYQNYIDALNQTPITTSSNHVSC